MHEQMGRYQFVYGLKPIGPHRRMADEKLSSLRRRCEMCFGRGIVDSDGSATWSRCSSCDTRGAFWTCSSEELETARVAVLQAFPDAEVKDPTPNYVGAKVVYHLGTGRIVNLQEAEADDEQADWRPNLAHDNDTIDLQEIVESGDCVYALCWDSGAPGAGAGQESVHHLDGRYVYASVDLGVEGPYRSLEEAIERHNQLVIITSAVTAVESSQRSDAELLPLLRPTESGLAISINGNLWQWQGSRWIRSRAGADRAAGGDGG